MFHEQQKYITELIMSQDKDVGQEKHLISPEKKRTDRFDQIMSEHKVKKRLEKEAVNLWLDEPYEERMIRVCRFRKEED